MEKKQQIWRQVLTRLLDVAKFLMKQKLPLRGHRDVYSSNKGNFIELVEFMSRSESVLGKDYFKRVNDNQWYLSLKIQNKFKSLGNHVKENILDPIRKPNYFAIIIDSTPDISNTDDSCIATYNYAYTYTNI